MAQAYNRIDGAMKFPLCEPSSKTQLSSIAEVLQYRARTQPEATAFTFLAGGSRESGAVSYAELDRKARQIAALLHQEATSSAALLLFPSGLEFLYGFFGCVYAGVVAIPAPPPEGIRMKRAMPRLQAIVQDAKPSLIICLDRDLEFLRGLCSQVDEMSRLRFLGISDQIFTEESGRDWQIADTNPNDTVYLQYTSGSTSSPKGVVLTHSNLISNLESLKQSWQYTERSVGVTWMPNFHDYGLVEGLLQPVYMGTASYILSPIAFIKKPICWLQAISRFKATHSGAPTFAFEFCIHRTTKDERAGLDLSSWRVASLGAERINARTIEQFAEIYAPYGFDQSAIYPSYGLAEATLLVATKSSKWKPTILDISNQAFVSGKVIEDKEAGSARLRVVGCGAPVPSTHVVIVDPETGTKCPTGSVGEIWVSGLGVARGYLNRAEETQSTFRAYLSDSDEGPFLRTGDLGFIWNDELFVTGRLKDLIIVRGMNHHPEDIEQTVSSCVSDLNGSFGLAFSVDIESEEKLVLVYEMKSRELSLETVEKIALEVQKVIAQQHSLQLYALTITKSGSLPRTSSGKTQRLRCRDEWLARTLPVKAQWQESAAL